MSADEPTTLHWWEETTAGNDTQRTFACRWCGAEKQVPFGECETKN